MQRFPSCSAGSGFLICIECKLSYSYILHITTKGSVLSIVTVLAGASGGPMALPPKSVSALPAAPALRRPDDQGPGTKTCLASALYSLRRRVRPHDAAWTPAFCRSLAETVAAVGERYDLSPALLVAVMMNESDMDEGAARVSRTLRGIAMDSGLMGIRCVLDRRGRCKNGLVRGLAWRDVMDPFTNVELAARYLAHYRDGAGRDRIVVRLRQADGPARIIERDVPCRHRNHAYWAHYNHGTRYIARGPARHYPQHVAVLYHALGVTLGFETSDTPPEALSHSSGAASRNSKLRDLILSTNLCTPSTAIAAATGTPAPERL